MEFLLFFLSIFSLFFSFFSAISFTEFVYPNFTASNLGFVDTSGSFLFSSNGTFKAAIFNPGNQQSRFYFCVIHTESNTVIWSANRDSPVSESGIMSFTINGIRINEDGSLKWSTPPLKSLVSALKLTETGNLLLLDQSNGTLWESFRNPTDTLVIGQKLFIGNTLLSSVSSDDLSTGNYRFGLTLNDAVLRWKNLTYWKMSMDTTTFVNANYGVEFMEINQTGLYLFGQNGSSVVIRVDLHPSKFRIAKVDHSGQFIVIGFSNASQKQDFLGPVDQCRIPLICARIGLCTSGVSVHNPLCSCPMNFRTTSNNTNNCVPADSSYSLPDSCNNSGINSSNLTYMQLGYGVDYFANDFTQPAYYGVNLTSCQDICSQDCSCLAVFYENSSGSCYKLENNLGSLISRASSNGRSGFVKTIIKSSNFDGFDENTLGFPTVAVVLLPLSGLIIVLAIGICLCRKYNNFSNEVKNKIVYSFSTSNSPSLEDLEFVIPGLPLRFQYEELQTATDNFKTKIGTGGFGTVYKGILPDRTLVAVKRVTSLGLRGKKDFCTEIAVIGNIHHVNLVKLKGYCAKKNQWLLVYEYMNRGSLDKTLFGHGPVLEWQERVDIAIGAAHGIAYLHRGCEHKIIHCDIKPENILLHDNFQAKISDFGLSKLLNREESGRFTTMRGTRGYLAPEWLTNSSISDKTDVYSFGMVLLELVSGRRNCPSTKSAERNSENSLSSSVEENGYFPLYALEMHEKGKYLKLVDKRLEGRVSSEEVEKLVRVALCCVHEEPGLRLSMGSVVGMLEGEMLLGEPRIESLNFLRFYGRRYAEASTAEETGQSNNVFVYNADANSCRSSYGSVSNMCFSYISSQQISGPR